MCARSFYLCSPEDPDIVKEAKKQPVSESEFSYSERDIILYNLGIGATEKELDFTYEQSDNFQALPTWGVIPQFMASGGIPMDFLPNFSPMMLLHGEQYLSIKKAIPLSATLINKPAIMEVLDKGKAAAVTSIVHTFDKNSGEVVFENQSTVFIRGSGGFGGKKTGKDRGPATAANKPPSRKPDVVIEEKTDERQAALCKSPMHFSSLPSFCSPWRTTFSAHRPSVGRLQPSAHRPKLCPSGRFRQADPSRALLVRYCRQTRVQELWSLQGYQGPLHRNGHPWPDSCYVVLEGG